jgi:hypothetical protein
MGRNVQDGMCRSIYYKQTGVMPEQSLYHAVLSSKEEILNYVVIDTFTPIRFLLSRTYYFPYQWRKLLLEACRVQQPILRNNYLSTLYQEVKDKESHTIITTDSTSAYSLSLNKVVRQFDNIYDNPMLCCLLSYFVRAEATAYPDQFFELYSKGANKEISASQLPMREQQLDYSCLTTDDVGTGIHHEVESFPYRTVALFKSHIKKSTFHFTSPGYVLFPYYNKRKNIGYATQSNLERRILGYNLPKQATKYTTLDLLKWYHLTGEEVEGPLEGRQSFNFGDIKPRFYYCLGGTCHWDGLYVKDLASDLVKMFPSTHPFSRFEIKRIKIISEDLVFITYDYTSFTTSLAELRYFLWYISTLFDNVEVCVLDVHTGPKMVNLATLLHRYNTSINQNSEYSIARIIGQRLCDGEIEILSQNRSGSLGVQGNIVFSTLNHGVSLSGLTDTPDEDSCVGDDAALSLHIRLLAVFGVIANKLGAINPEKVTVIHPPHIDDVAASTRDAYKYLKRPVHVQWGGAIITGFLDFFPNLAPIIFPGGDGIHSGIDESEGSTLRTFVMQWGRFLNVMRSTPFSMDQVDEDIEFILIIIRSVYTRAGLPYDGAIPGSGFKYVNLSRYYSKDEEPTLYNVNFYVPPCDNAVVFQTDWLELLLARLAGREFSTPVWVTGPVPMPQWTFAGDECFVTSTPLSRLLVGLDYASAEVVIRPARFDEMFVDEYGDFIRGKEKGRYQELIDLRIYDLPSWYADAWQKLYPTPSGNTRYYEATVEISTMFGESE